MDKDKFKIFIDMDGVLAEFKMIDHIEMLYEQNYFLNLNPQINVVEGIKNLIDQTNGKKDVEIYILSSVLKDSRFAETEKNQWLDKYLPQIDEKHRIFLPYGTEKSAIHDLNSKCILIDDYTTNLNDWDRKGGIAIKLINPINNRHHTWKGAKIDYCLNPVLMAYTIKRIMIEEYSKKFNIKDLEKRAKRNIEMQKAKEKDNPLKDKTMEVSR